MLARGSGCGPVNLGDANFIALLSGAAVAWPDVARAQQPAVPAIGFLSTGSAASFASPLAAFHRGLNDNGYVDGQNVKIEYRWVEGRYDQLPALAADAAIYADRILRGAEPGELPVQLPVKIHLTINLRTAKALGLNVPSSFLLRADEVIE